jgi:hypothetical protein
MALLEIKLIEIMTEFIIIYYLAYHSRTSVTNIWKIPIRLSNFRRRIFWRQRQNRLERFESQLQKNAMTDKLQRLR